MRLREVILLLCVVLLTVTGVRAQTFSCSAASKFYSKDSINIVTFGASTVHGVNGYSFQPFLKQNFEQCYVGKVVDITNNGVSGETTTQGLLRIDAAIKGRTGFICILMGINDVFIYLTNPKIKVTTAQANERLAIIQNNMQIMIDKSLKQGLIPIIGTLQYVLPNNSANKATNNYVNRINAIYKALVIKNKIYLADINAALNYNVKAFQADGLHPNEIGDKIISYVWFDSINDAIENKLLLVGLNQNYPNPASTTTKIVFSLTQPGRVVMQLYSMTGRLVSTFADAFYNSGFQEITLDVSSLKPGIYIYAMLVSGRVISKKMIVVR
jgi:acyl-CoA thioesterase-1